MFGEKEMFGIREFKVKKRSGHTYVVIPIVSGIEENDVLILIPREDYIEIWNHNDFAKILKKLEEKLNDCMSIKEIEYYRTLINKYYSIRVFGKRTLAKDNNNSTRYSLRFNLGSQLVDYYHFDDGGILEGKGQCVRLWNVQKFQDYKKQSGEIELPKFTAKVRVKKKIEEN